MIATLLTLHRKRYASIKRRHPWIFSRGIYSDTSNLLDGDHVAITDEQENVLAIGHFQHGSIAVRILSFDHTEITKELYRQRISEAMQARALLGLPNQDTNAYRLIHGEGDQLPGLIIDIYDRVAVIQTHSIGMHRDLSMIVEALQSELSDQISSIYNKSGSTLPHNYQTDTREGLLAGEPCEEVSIIEHKIPFRINVVSGQKTGFFLDQRNNRELLGQYATGKTVLNCFCYTGGFSLYALAADASKVDSIDISASAMQLLEQQVRDLKYEDRHQGLTENVLQFLTAPNNETYDIVVVDPPAFAKRINKRHNAVQAYKRLNTLALAKVKQGGLLFTFSCSQVIDNQLFYDTIVAASIESQRVIRVIHRLSQGGDHPVNIYHPEGNYLKGLVLHVS